MIAEGRANIGVLGGDITVRVGVQTDGVEADETEVRRLAQVAAQQVNGFISCEHVGFVHDDWVADLCGQCHVCGGEHG